MLATITKSSSFTSILIPTASVEVQPIRLFFSYETLVGFKLGDEEPVVRINEWSTIAGKHLNNIDGGSAAARARRLSASEFEAAYTTRVGAFTL